MLQQSSYVIVPAARWSDEIRTFLYTVWAQVGSGQTREVEQAEISQSVGGREGVVNRQSYRIFSMFVAEKRRKSKQMTN